MLASPAPKSKTLYLLSFTLVVVLRKKSVHDEGLIEDLPWHSIQGGTDIVYCHL